MVRPTVVKIGPYIWKIDWFDRDTSDRIGAFGACHNDTLTISMSADAPSDHVADTFIHEVYHALSYLFNANKEITPEKAAHIAGVGLLMVWRDNPDVFAWWSSLLTEESK